MLLKRKQKRRIKEQILNRWEKKTKHKSKNIINYILNGKGLSALIKENQRFFRLKNKTAINKI